jgi:phage shock protein A
MKERTMTYEPRDRPRSLVSRLRNLLRGMFAIWIRDSETQNPRAVYEQAIDERTRQYRQLKEAVAGILYMRNKLEAEITERRAEIARTHDDIRRAVRRGQDDISLTLIAQKQNLMEELERAERELEGVRSEAEEAKANLVRFREEIRGLMREKSRMLATLANAQARRRIQEALDGLSVDADMRALESVREHVARLSTEGSLERELGDPSLRTRLRAIRDEAREEAARRELAELKQQFLPEGAPAAVPTAEQPLPVSAV